MTHNLHNESAEQAVLCAMLLTEDAISECQTYITAESFYRPGHATLFRAIGDLHRTGAAVDPITIIHHLESNHTLSQVGGRDYLAFLIDAAPTAANVAYHAKIVRELADRRAAVTIGESLIRAAGDTTIPVQNAAQEATQALLPTAAGTTRTGFRHISEIIPEVVDELEAMMNGIKPGLSLGFSSLDERTGGMIPGELMFVCAVPGGGKTALAINIGLQAAQRGEGVAFVSAEMKDRSLVKRIASNMAQVSGEAFRKGTFEQVESVRVGTVFRVVSGVPFWIDDTKLPSITTIEARARALKAKHPELRWLIVDYFQLVKAAGKDDNHARALMNVANELKGLAKELDVAVIAACQVDAANIEKRENKRPQLSDLRWSQGPREAADFVALLYRDAVYNMAPEDLIEIHFAKAREVEPFTVTLKWIGQFMRFQDRPQRPGSGHVL